MQATVHRSYPAEEVRRLLQASIALGNLPVYAIRSSIGGIMVLPVGHQRFRKAALKSGHEPNAAVSLQVDDRFAWLTEAETVVLIDVLSQALAMARLASPVAGSAPNEAVATEHQ